MAKRKKTAVYQVEGNKWVRIGVAVNRPKTIRLWFPDGAPARTWLTILKEDFIDEFQFPKEEEGGESW